MKRCTGNINLMDWDFIRIISFCFWSSIEFCGKIKSEQKRIISTVVFQKVYKEEI